VSAAPPDVEDPDDDCLATALCDPAASSSDDPPVNALLLAFAITTVYILVGSFRLLVTLIGIVEYTFFFLTIAGLLILRVREPLRPRPFRPPLFVPAVFCLISVSLVLRTMIHVPLQAAFFALLLAASLLLRKFSQ
jgi:amino acid transporter